jgi:hypothetical protein
LASTPASTSGKEKADAPAACDFSAVSSAMGLTVAAVERFETHSGVSCADQLA